jgi:hypothetical protein
MLVIALIERVVSRVDCLTNKDRSFDIENGKFDYYQKL